VGRQLLDQVHVLVTVVGNVRQPDDLDTAALLVEAGGLEGAGEEGDTIASAAWRLVLQRLKDPAPPPLAPAVRADPQQPDRAETTPHPRGETADEFAVLVGQSDRHVTEVGGAGRGDVEGGQLLVQPSLEFGVVAAEAEGRGGSLFAVIGAGCPGSWSVLPNLWGPGPEVPGREVPGVRRALA